MASEIKILRKFYDDILKKETNYCCDLSAGFIFRFRYNELKYPRINSKNYTLTVMRDNLPLCNPIIHEINDDNSLYINRKQNHIELIEDFISSTDEELVLTYGRDILDTAIMNIIHNDIPELNLNDFSNFLQGIKI